MLLIAAAAGEKQPGMPQFQVSPFPKIEVAAGMIIKAKDDQFLSRKSEDTTHAAVDFGDDIGDGRSNDPPSPDGQVYSAVPLDIGIGIGIAIEDLDAFLKAFVRVSGFSVAIGDNQRANKLINGVADIDRDDERDGRPMQSEFAAVLQALVGLISLRPQDSMRLGPMWKTTGPRVRSDKGSAMNVLSVVGIIIGGWSLVLAIVALVQLNILRIALVELDQRFRRSQRPGDLKGPMEPINAKLGTLCEQVRRFDLAVLTLQGQDAPIDAGLLARRPHLEGRAAPAVPPSSAPDGSRDALLEEYRKLIAQPKKADIDRWMDDHAGEGCEATEEGVFRLLGRDPGGLLVLVPLRDGTALVLPSGRRTARR